MVLLQSCQVGLQVQAGRLCPKGTQQLVINQPVLDRDFGGGVSSGPAAQLLGLQQHAVRPFLPQAVGAQQSRDPAAYDQNVCIQISLQRGEPGSVRRLCLY